jgi:hypothetical protein
MASLSIPLAMLLATAGPWRTYEVYRPAIERHFVVDASASRLKYNHDSTLAWFVDRWYCLWNANEVAAEGKPGQLNYQATSADGRTWSAPVPAFSSEEACINPVPCPTGTQWQPTFLVVGEELWAIWCQNSRDDSNGTYLSRLRTPGGRWENLRLTWDGNPQPEVDGKRWRLFPTQNMIRLRSGRILAPVTMIGPMATDIPANLERGFWGNEKRNSVLYSDDNGATWTASPGTTQPGRSWAQWEPTVWELPDGTVRMFARNNDHRSVAEGGPGPTEMLLQAESHDGGATWSPSTPVPLETVCSRMHVVPAGGDRFLMTHNDWPAGRFVADRRNLAVFSVRGSGTNFVAGPGYTEQELCVCYPHLWLHDGAAWVSYSQGMGVRSIKVARISPLPEPGRYYLFPRTNFEPAGDPQPVPGALAFRGHQRLETRGTPDPGAEGFSLAAWVRADAGGVLWDNRPPDSRAGFVVALTNSAAGLQPYVFLGTPERNLIAEDIKLPAGAWAYVGVTVDVRQGTAAFWCNGQAQTLRFTPPVQSLRGASAYVGEKRFAASGLAGLSGDLRALRLYAGTVLTPANHAWLSAQWSRAAAGDAQEPAVAPLVSVDASDPAALGRDFVPCPEPADELRVEDTAEGTVLCLRGETSAGVDLDENLRQRGDVVELELMFRPETAAETVLCTVGDGNDPVRVILSRGRATLLTARGEADCGALLPDAWNRLRIATCAAQTTAQINGGAVQAAEHHPEGTWLYLGQGYRTGKAAGEVRILVSSVRTRVTPGGATAP